MANESNFSSCDIEFFTGYRLPLVSTCVFFGAHSILPIHLPQIPCYFLIMNFSTQERDNVSPHFVNGMKGWKGRLKNLKTGFGILWAVSLNFNCFVFGEKDLSLPRSSASAHPLNLPTPCPSESTPSHSARLRRFLYN